MNRFSLKSLLILILFFVGSGCASGLRWDRSPAYDIDYVYSAVPINQELRDEWYLDFFKSDEIWIIKDKQVFFNYLRNKSFAAKDIELIESYFSSDLNHKIGTLYSFWSSAYNKYGGFVHLPQSAKDKLPSYLLRKVYTYLIEKEYPFPYYHFSLLSDGELFIDSLSAPRETKKRLKQMIVLTENKYLIMATPELWSVLPISEKDRFINILAPSNSDSSKYIRVNVNYSDESEIVTIARKYAGGRDPVPIERYLRRQLSKSPTGEASVPLQNILHPFIREKIYSYDPNGGPNCYNSGLCVHQGREYDQKFINDLELLKSLKAGFTQLDEGVPLRTGDVLAYFNLKSDKLIHVATYIDEKIVFTKNGINKFNPYSFQKREDMESVYFPQGQFKLSVFRPIIGPIQPAPSCVEITQ